jgi:uncharacterized membrane protein
MPGISDFLTNEEKKRVVTAIEEAEKNTIGEIRVHLEKRCWGNAYTRARIIFTKLAMEKTAGRTGVLIYIAVKSHKMAIIGDSGIDAKVNESFWQKTLDNSLKCFKENRYADGITDAVQQCGAALEKHFPKTPGNPDELSNEISFG